MQTRSWQVQRCTTDVQLQQILQLQQANVPEVLSPEELAAQGFVTVRHTFDLLNGMNQAEPHAIAVADGQVVGYVLVMLKAFAPLVPVLQPMFREFEQIPYGGKPLTDYTFFACGQACVHKAYRGQRMLDAMYEQLRHDLHGQYALCLTEIACSNLRSLQAHRRIGFESVWQYHDGYQDWHIVAWKL